MFIDLAQSLLKLFFVHEFRDPCVELSGENSGLC